MRRIDFLDLSTENAMAATDVDQAGRADATGWMHARLPADYLSDIYSGLFTFPEPGEDQPDLPRPLGVVSSRSAGR